MWAFLIAWRPSSVRPSVCLSVCKLFFSRITEPISTKLDTNNPWVKGIHIGSNQGPCPFPRGDKYGIAKLYRRNLKIFNLLQNHWTNFNETWHKHSWIEYHRKPWFCWLVGCMEFIVPLEKFSLIWRRHHCWWRAANFDLPWFWVHKLPPTWWKRESMEITRGLPTMWMKFVLLEGPRLLPRGDYFEVLKYIETIEKSFKFGWNWPSGSGEDWLIDWLIGRLKKLCNQSIFSRTTGLISTELGTKHPWVQGIQICSNKEPFDFQSSPYQHFDKIICVYWFELFFRWAMWPMGLFFPIFSLQNGQPNNILSHH